MERTISGMVGKGSVNHNSRKFNAKNTDPARTHLNVEFCNEPIKEVYHRLFDEALEKYNAKQTRKDRMISDYYEHIAGGKQEKPFHEIILQVGNMEDMASQSENGDLAKEILAEYYQGFQERNPNLYVFSAHLHMDEATPHIHIDFVPFTTGSKRGLETRVSLKKALAEEGFEGGSRSDTEWNQWVDSEKEQLALVMERHGINWKQLDTHETHRDVTTFKRDKLKEEIEQLDERLSLKKSEAVVLDKKIEGLIAAEEEIVRIGKDFKEKAEYDLPEPERFMSAKTYKANFAEPVFSHLKALIKELIKKIHEFSARLQQAENKAAQYYNEAYDLREENAVLRKENQDMYDRLKDYKTLGRAYGSVELYHMIDEAYKIQEKKARNCDKSGLSK